MEGVYGLEKILDINCRESASVAWERLLDLFMEQDKQNGKYTE